MSDVIEGAIYVDFLEVLTLRIGMLAARGMLIRTSMVNMGANTIPDLDILTIWDPFKGTFGEKF